jgi:protoheme IX farnesyltransferase
MSRDLSSPAPSDTASARAPAAKARFNDYLELTKPRLSLLSVITAMVGYFATKPVWETPVFWSLFLGTSLCAGGVAALNQWMESDTDALMKRTADRPIPSGKIPAGSAFIVGWGMSAAGLAILFIKVDSLAAFFALATIVSYLAFYTPAKRWSRWSTEIGAVAGAFPPLIGWAASSSRETSLGWILFGILLFWQIPHFMAIAWIYREEYATVHFPMLPVRDAAGGKVAAWSLVNTLALVAVTAAPSFLGLTSHYYLGVTAVLGLWFIARAIAFMRATEREKTARKLFYASIIWLPLQLAALVADRWLF